MAKRKRKRRAMRSREEWRGLIERWRRSGMSGQEFADAHDIGLASLYGWKSRLASEDAGGTFVPVKVDGRSDVVVRTATDRPAAVLDMGACRLWLSPDAEPRWVAAVVRELSEC